jgi:GTP cyclohydrolase II
MIQDTNFNINVVDLFPMEVFGRTCLCIGFEPSTINLGDQFHIALIFSHSLKFTDEISLYEIMQNISPLDMTVRIHSECLLGDVFKSQDCDCAFQLENSLKSISSLNSGILIYLRQEGRGIGLRKKLACLSLQKGYYKGYPTLEKYSADDANIFMNEEIDKRDYSIAADFLKYINVLNINLLSGNPKKEKDLSFAGIKVNAKKMEIDYGVAKLSLKAKSELKEKVGRGYFYKIIDNEST